MDYEKFREEYKKRLYNSSFQEAKRKFANSKKLVLNNSPKLSDILKLDKLVMVGQKIMTKDKTPVFVMELKDDLVSIGYKLKENFYIKTIQKLNENTYKYTELIKMKKSPWGIERVFMQKAIKKEFKMNIEKTLNVFNK